MKRWGWGGGMNSTSGVTGSRYRRPFTVRIRCRHQLITVVQLDGGQTRSCRWGWSCNIKVSLETRDFCVRNKGLWRVKPRSSGGERPDFRMRKKGFFSFLSCLFLCRFKRAQGNEFIYIYIINIFILRCRIETQWTKKLCNLLAMNGLYWDIDCTVCLPWWNRSGGNC